MKRNATNDFNFWNDENFYEDVPLKVIDWAPGKPDGTDGCVGAFTAFSGQRDDVDCATPFFNAIVCESFTVEYFDTWTIGALPNEMQSLTNDFQRGQTR
jgi:hypothetical protein